MIAAILALLCVGLGAMLRATVERERRLVREVIDAQRAQLLAAQDLRDLEIARAELEADLAAVTAERDALAALPRVTVRRIPGPTVCFPADDEPALRSEGG